MLTCHHIHLSRLYRQSGVHPNRELKQLWYKTRAFFQNIITLKPPLSSFYETNTVVDKPSCMSFWDLTIKMPKTQLCNNHITFYQFYARCILFKHFKDTPERINRRGWTSTKVLVYTKLYNDPNYNLSTS